ncbi:putative choline transporter, neither null mutation nor overexpression affects choline transport, partial [Spiromyces aspiralis]
MPAKDEINKAQPKFRDWWAAIAFLVVCGVFIWLSVLFLSALPGDMFKSGRSASQATNFYSWPTVVMVLIFIVIGFLVSVIYLMAIQHASEFIINMSYTLVVAAMLAGAIYYLVARVWFAGALLLAGGLLTGYLWFKYWRHYVKFTSAILKAVCRVFWKFTSTLWASFVFLVVACGFSILWALVLAGSLKYFSCETDTSSQGVKHKVCKEGASKVLSLIYLVFAYYWIVQVLSGVLYTTICGVFGTHFFFPDGQYPYKNPLLSSLRRATTYSFGSVCFGSLILAIIQTIRLMIKNMQSETSDFLCGVVLCIIQCILGGIQWLAEFITEYAYVDVALFGNSFVTASKRTNELMESSGMRMVANDCLVDSVLFCGG